MGYLFADDVGTPIIKTLNGIEVETKLLIIAGVLFMIFIVCFAVVLFILKRKLGKTKNKDYIELR